MTGPSVCYVDHAFKTRIRVFVVILYNILLKHVYDQAVKDCNSGCHNWVYNVKKLLVDYEFVDIFDNAHVLNTKSFPLVF